MTALQDMPSGIASHVPCAVVTHLRLTIMVGNHKMSMAMVDPEQCTNDHGLFCCTVVLG